MSCPITTCPSWIDKSGFCKSQSHIENCHHKQGIDRLKSELATIPTRATKLTRGCVVKMRASSGMLGHGNHQCVSSACEELGTVSLFGHNEHYHDYDVEAVLEYPFEAALKEREQS